MNPESMAKLSGLLAYVLAEMAKDGESPEPTTEPTDAPAVPTPRVMTGPERVVAFALAEWQAGITEPTASRPNGAERIDFYIRSPKAHGASSAQLPKNPHDTVAYTRNGQWSWCIAFCMACHGAADCPAETRRKRGASTYKLQATEEMYGPAIPKVSAADLQPGDILVVGDGDPWWGDHGCIVESVNHDTGLVYTIEGNAHGVLPGGALGEGVVKRTRPLDSRQMGKMCPVSGYQQTMRFMAAFRPETVAK